MMIWRQVSTWEDDILTEAAQFECAFPRFYREASQVWTVDEAAVLEFYRSCDLLYGIWDTQVRNEETGIAELAGLIYLQPVTEWHKVVHLDSKRGADKKVILSGACRIRDNVFRQQGIKEIQTWALRQNRPLQDMLKAIGFQRTGLEMKSGKAHGQTVKWLQMIIREVNH